MKTNSLILILFAIVFISGHLQAQDDLPYRSFNKFNNDTIRYLDYNFSLRREQYENKTVAELLKDLELPVVYVSSLMLTPKSDYKGIDINAMNLVIRLIRNGGYDNDNDDSKDYYIRIFLNPAADGQDFMNAVDKGKRSTGKNGLLWWTPPLYEFLKDFQIKAIVSNYKLFDNRRYVIENAETVEQHREQLKKIIDTEKANWRKRIQEEKQAANK